MVVALAGVLLPVLPDPEARWLPVLDVVVARVVLEDIRPVVTGQVPVTDSGHQVPNRGSESHKFVYLGPISRHSVISSA